jgi:L-alanine-DL-glutamate epimerase-like enolase superfamily enzyme
MMKIREIKVNFVRLPLEEPLVGAPYMPGMLREFFTVQVQTDEGIEGIGVTGFGGKLVRALKAAIEDFGELIRDDDPLRTEQVTAKLRAASASCGSGIATLAISAIDTALWDIRGKAFGVPLARLLGGLRDKVPAYASGALTRTTPNDKLERAASALVEKGYSQIKTQMAVEGFTPAQEVERVSLIRDAVGPDVNLMVDINQRWSVAEAISIGHRVEGLGLGWLEDPTTCDDYQGLAKIADALTTPICAGEYLWGIEPHRQAMSHHSVDITMIDLLRVGGVTQWMKVAGIGGGLQQACSQPLAAGNPSAPGRRRAKRTGRRIHAVDLAPVRQSADAGQRRNDRASRTRARAEIRARPVRQIRHQLAKSLRTPLNALPSPRERSEWWEGSGMGRYPQEPQLQ